MDFSHIPEQIISASQVVGALVVILGFVAGIKKYILNPIFKHLSEVRAQFAKLEWISAQLKPNGGSSIKDEISEIKKSVAVIRQRQRVLLSYEGQAVFESDAKGFCTIANRSYLRLLEATLDEVQGNGWRNFIHPFSRDRVFEEWDAAVKDKRDFKMTYMYTSASGVPVCVSCEAFAIKTDAGELQGYLGVVHPHEDLDKCK